MTRPPLAEAEIEYSDETSPSIFVRFEMTSKPAGLENFDGPVDFYYLDDHAVDHPLRSGRFPQARRRLRCR